MKTSVPTKCSMHRAKDEGIWRGPIKPHFRFLNVPCFNYNTQYTGHRLEVGQTASFFTVFTNYCGFLTSHKFPRVLCNPKVHYIVLNSLSPVSTLNQYTTTPFKTHFTISCNQCPGRQIGLFHSLHCYILPSAQL